eukprot:8826049-Pyramimonas_sp.AAC.1
MSARQHVVVPGWMLDKLFWRRRPRAPSASCVAGLGLGDCCLHARRGDTRVIASAMRSKFGTLRHATLQTSGARPARACPVAPRT